MECLGRVVLIITLMLGASGPAAIAQTEVARGAGAQSKADSTVHAQADRLYYDDHAAESLALLRTRLTQYPDDVAALWRAARAALMIGWLESNETVSIQSYLEAERFAREAIRIAPTGTEA